MRVVVIGMGVQGQKRRDVARRDVAATIDPLPGRGDYTDIDQVPVDAYDAALVSTPEDAKVPLLQKLLSSGKHVLVEKPLLATPAELNELAALAAKNRVTCYTAYNHRFEPHIARLARLLASGVLGKLYSARLFYGNGTAANVKASPWRDQGMGVLADLGSHLLDMAAFLFGQPKGRATLISSNSFENRAPDHVAFGFDGTPALQFEATLLSWKNTFHLDVLGELGTAHIDCLCKWGPSTLTVRRRILPSGKPPERYSTLVRPDPTWKLEYRHFRELCRTGEGNLQNDLWISSVFQDLNQQRTLRCAA